MKSERGKRWEIKYERKERKKMEVGILKFKKRNGERNKTWKKKKRKQKLQIWRSRRGMMEKIHVWKMENRKEKKWKLEFWRLRKEMIGIVKDGKWEKREKENKSKKADVDNECDDKI